MLGRIVLWLIIIAVGGAVAYYSANLVEMLWRSSWAEEHVWGTRQLWVLIWFWAIVVWGLVMLWLVSFADPTDMSAAGL